MKHLEIKSGSELQLFNWSKKLDEKVKISSKFPNKSLTSLIVNFPASIVVLTAGSVLEHLLFDGSMLIVVMMFGEWLLIVFDLFTMFAGQFLFWLSINFEFLSWLL